MTLLRRSSRTRLAVAALATSTLVASTAQLSQVPALASGSASAAPDLASIRTLADPVHGLTDIDTRGTALPTALQKQQAGGLGALVRWNAFGTPASILPKDGSLGAASGDPATAARSWLRSHADVFGMSAADIDALELVNSQAFSQSSARAVLFRQTFDGLAPALGSLVTVGVANGEIAYVSSSLVRTDATPAAADLSALDGWLAAAKDVGQAPADVDAIDVVDAADPTDWTQLTVPGLAQTQQVRLRALAMADGTVHRVWEANVVNSDAGAALAYTVLVDASTGDVLARTNQVENHQAVENFSGSFTATQCGPRHPFELTDDLTRTILMVGSAAPADDITIKLYDPAGQVLGGYDLLTSPETGTYTADKIPAGTYSVQVCPFDAASAVVGQYALTVATSDQAAPSGGAPAHEPRWNQFLANPTLDSPTQTPTNDATVCWVANVAACDDPPGTMRNIAAFGPWDTTASGIPTFTTIGNNASTHEAWASPLTPGGLGQAPYSPTGDYTGEFTDAWNNSKCDPSQLVPGGNDIMHSVGNLFVSHNRMHDFSYYLGFTEKNYNLQAENAGRGGVGGDAEIGNAQAGALTGGTPSYLGRDNANQITLQDGVPGITNQYLFQPIAGAFYSPCTDGGLDMGIVGHEYTHAISNRMIAGPDEGITSEQGGAMGESWGDLVAGEYQFAHGYKNGGNTWAVGLYATGNKRVAIRDYAINNNPLNYSDYGFDSTGPEVHADGEIWNGTMWQVRQALVKKYDAQYPSTNAALQRRCAQATANASPLRASQCPGNRRWVQLVFDAFLLQQGATSMLDARDAMIAADRMRFGGANRTLLWQAFAKRGMGAGASTPTADSEDVVPAFNAATGGNGTVTFSSTAPGRVYIGRYEARVTPIADTLAGTGRGATASFTPGTYQVLFVAPGRGFTRTSFTVTAGQSSTVRFAPTQNLASSKAGASVIGSSPGSLNAESLIDDTEATNWAGINDGTNVDAQHPWVAVDLAGGVQTIKRVQVSAMLRPAGAEDADADSGSRFTALRSFAVEVCTSECATSSATWKRIYTSPAAAFPAVQPRPVAPDLILRSFDVPDTQAAAVRLVALENQCTGHAGYAGEQDNDPLNDTDCKTASDRGQSVRAAEFQVY